MTESETLNTLNDKTLMALFQDCKGDNADKLTELSAKLFPQSYTKNNQFSLALHDRLCKIYSDKFLFFPF